MTRREWLAFAAAATPLAAANPDIDRFFEEFFRDWVRAQPEMATSMRLFTGDEQFRLDSQLSDISDAAAHARIARAKAGLAKLRTFDRASLSPEQRLSAEILAYQLDSIVAEEPFLAYNFPLNQFRGAQVNLPGLMTDLHPLRTSRDTESYIARLTAAGPKIDEALAQMRERDRQGIRLPGFIAVETINQMKRFTTPAPAQNILVTSFATRVGKIDSLDAAKRTELTSRVEGIVRDSLYPAYRRASDGLSTINSKASEDAGLWRLPRGADAYAFNLRRYTTTDLSPEQIHQKGRSEVARIEAEMDGLLKRLGYREGNIKERYRKLEDDQNYPDSPNVRDQVLADFGRIIRENNERSLEAFNRRPKSPCIVQRIPEFQEANAAANYQSPAPDGSRPGIFRVPLRGPHFTRVGMRTLAAHEAIPGHHFQIATQVEMTSLPGFRRQSPFGSMSAFTEGWGLYAERLASELGWYKDDLVSDTGRLNAELFRARRLVVDTGLHAKRWTRQQSIDYGISQSEVDRYVMMPGQACSYKIGQLKILELREEAKRQMGARFSLKEFHNVVLGNGSIPLTILERVVRDWEKNA